MAADTPLVVKLIEMEDARKTLEQGLRHVTNQAVGEVRRFLDAPASSAGLRCALSESLGAKCRVLNNLVADLQDLTEVHVSCASVAPTQLYLCDDYAVLPAEDLLGSGPASRHVPRAGAIGQTVRVLGPPGPCPQQVKRPPGPSPQHLKRPPGPSLQHLKRPPGPSPQHLKRLPEPEAVHSDVLCSEGAGRNARAEATRRPSSELQVKERALALTCEEEAQVSRKAEPPVTVMSDCRKRSPEAGLLLPTEPIGGPRCTKMDPDARLAVEDLVRDSLLPHPKETDAQLLDFLQRGNPENVHLNASSSSSSSRCIEASPPREDTPDVFRVKRVEPSGSVVYSYMVLTKTELWDLGEVVQRVATPGPMEQVAAREQQKQQQQQSEGENRQHPALARDTAATPQIPRSATNTTCGVGASARAPAQAQVVAPAPAQVPALTGPSRPTSIPGFKICAFQEIEVVVSHVVTPGNFYIQRPDVMAKQRALVKDWTGPTFAEENIVPDVGTLVMVFPSDQKQWYRGRVVKICGVSGGDTGAEGVRAGGGGGGGVTHVSVAVLRLDYGDTTCVTLSSVGHLTRDMAALPLQAIQVSLVDVAPVEGREGAQWTQAAVSWFRAMVEGRTLYARLHPRPGSSSSTSSTSTSIDVQLFLEKGRLGAMRRGPSISQRLAQSGHAKQDNMKALDRIKPSDSKRQMKAGTDWQRRLISLYIEKNRSSEQTCPRDGC